MLTGYDQVTAGLTKGERRSSPLLPLTNPIRSRRPHVSLHNTRYEWIEAHERAYPCVCEDGGDGEGLEGISSVRGGEEEAGRVVLTMRDSIVEEGERRTCVLCLVQYSIVNKDLRVQIGAADTSVRVVGSQGACK